MSELRFKIKEQKIDMRRLFVNLGFRKDQKLSFEELSKFLRSINPDISREE